MSVKTAYVSKLGADYKLSEHFTLGEFQCNDGSDKVLYSPSLIEKLEALRTYLGPKCTININSGYRTSAYNVKIGGASKSKHTEGVAADIKVRVDGDLILAKYICCIAQDLGFKGIAMIKGGASTHLDMRESGTYRGDETYGYSNNVGGDFYSYFNIKQNKITSMKYIEPVVESGVYELEDEDMKYYKTVDDVPSWYRDAIDAAIEKGALTGTGSGEINVSEDLCRTLTILNRLGVIK